MAAAAPAGGSEGQRVSDPSTLSNFNDALITHSDIELDVDFDSRALTGHVEHTVLVKTGGLSELALDTADLTVQNVAVNGQAAQFGLSEPQGTKGAFGRRLSIALPPGLQAGDRLRVGLAFAASPQATAVQWLSPELTAGKQHPYLFTQCQAIHARSILPCQDSPAAKFTYTAAVRVPRPLRALMSAVPVEEDEAAGGQGAGGAAAQGAPAGQAGEEGGVLQRVDPRAKPGTTVYRFRQAVPIPSYLLALAVGHLQRRELGPISALWSEPEMVEAGAYEFEETPRFLEVAAELAGPYVWGRYDLLLLPPSFPYGGMENACLTFIGPALLAGDRSMTKTIAHEIAHSWTGNLVTNASWEHLWLNEGATRFLERKILGRLGGEQMYQLQAAVGWLVLKEAVEKEFGRDHPFTALVPDLSGGVDPDEALSAIPYEKGFAFLHYLQTVVGGGERFEPFFREYIAAFSSTPVTSERFRQFFCRHFQDEPALEQIDWDAWLYAPGMPPVTNEYDESLAKQAYELAKRWHTADVMGIGGGGPPGASADDVQGWTTTQVAAFVDKLAELRCLQPLHPTITRRLDELYGLDARRNSELRTSWHVLCINAGDDAILPLTEAFLKEQGRVRYLRKIYRALSKSRSPAAREAALRIFREAAPGYHPIAVRTVGGDLGLTPEAEHAMP